MSMTKLACLLVLCAGARILCAAEPVTSADPAGQLRHDSPVPAGNLPPKLLSSFEPGGPDFVQGKGIIVAEHASDGTHAYQVTSQDNQYRGIEITSGAALRLFPGYTLFKVDVFNPQDMVVRLTARVDDAESKDYGSRYNDDEVVAPPGASTITLNLTGLTRCNARSFAERQKIHLNTLRLVAVYFATQQPTTLYFDNVRLEGSGLPAVEGLRAFAFGPVHFPVYPGFEGCDAATTYNAKRGWGWINPGASDNVYMPDELTGNYVCGREFRVDLPNGKYEVHLCIDQFGLWATYPNFTERTLRINGQQVLREQWTSKDFMARRYYAHEDDEDLPGQDWWEKYIAPRNLIRHYSVVVTDGALHVNLDADSRLGAGICFLVVYPKSSKTQGDQWIETLQAQRKEHFNKTLVVRLPEVKDIPVGGAGGAGSTNAGFAIGLRSAQVDFSLNMPFGTDAEAASLEATPGERVHTVLGIWPRRQVQGVTVRVSDFVGAEGKTLPAAILQCRKIRNFLKREGSSRLGTIEPRILVDFQTLDLAPGWARGVWLTARVPEAAAPGTYRATVTVGTQAGALSVPLTLTVLPFQLDKITDMTLSVTGSTAGHWRTWYPELDEPWWQNAERVMKDQADHGMNAITGGPGARLIAVRDGKAQIDYGDMDRWLALAARYGLTMPGDAYQGLTVDGLPWNQGPKMLERMETESRKRLGISYQELIRIVFADVAQHAQEKGWPARIYSYLDEPRPAYGNVESCAAWIKLVTAAAPGTLFAGFYSSGAGRDGYFDTLPVSITHLDKIALERTARAGKQLWDYDGEGVRYNIGRWAFVAHQAGLKGYLRNGYMYVCSDPYFDFSDDEGSWCVVYPSRNGLNDTVGWERTSDGVNDYRYLATLTRLIREARQQGKARSEADAAEAYLKQSLQGIDLLDRKTADLTPKGFAAFRHGLAGHIAALTAAAAR
jgi:hypothetical protein